MGSERVNSSREEAVSATPEDNYEAAMPAP